ncbi:hypothetical protein [Nonlabens ponticola]|uniref:hypothetical protein n=1 Tax=Nonlabens ponticola TaxID=2496866 RepID=UPI0019D2362A|nr:hypothetical protein [Nonlabens ponticola]
MKKKIAADLTSLAHRILQHKKKDDVVELQAIAKELYEKLTVLAFTEKHFGDVKPTAGTKEVEQRLDQAFQEAQRDVRETSDEVEQVMEEAQEEVREAFSTNNLSDLFVADTDTREEMDLPGISTIQQMVVEMPDEAPDAPEEEDAEGYRTTGKLPNRYRDSFTTNSLTQLEVPEDGNRDDMDLPGISTINEMVGNMPDKSPETPEPSEKIYHDLKKERDKELEKERQSYTTNSLTHLVVPEDGQDDEMDLPGIGTIHKLVTEFPYDDEPELKTPKQSTTTDLEQLTADFQTMPVFERKDESNATARPQSLNSSLGKGFKVGMNDRIGFVKHLFKGSTADFDRVLSQLNTFKTYDEASNFIHTMIKPDYNQWSGKEAYEQRFMELIERNYN